MQACKPGYLSGSVSLSTHVKGKQRAEPVWLLRYRIPGKQSESVLGKAWQKQSRPPAGYLTRSQAEAAAQQFLDKHADSVPEDRKTLGRGCEEFLAYCETERQLRGSTLHEYRRIAETVCERPWRAGTWRERMLDRFTEEDLITLRAELTDAGRSADTINHYRRIIRGIFGKEYYGRWTLPAHSPAHAWAFKSVKAEAEGSLRHYDRDQIGQLYAAAEQSLDLAIWTLAVEAGPRQSEIRALRVRNVNFERGLIIIEHAFTTKGGHGGTKSHKLRSVPMSDNIRATIAPYCQGKDGDALVFEHPELPGTPMTGFTMYRRLQAAAERAGIPVLRFHDLRHTYGTSAVSFYDDITEVQYYMGHSKIDTTMRYVHFVTRPDAAAKASAFFAPQSTDNVIPIRKAS